ncbi:Chaperonin GroEL [Dirofilaria immitis]
MDAKCEERSEYTQALMNAEYAPLMCYFTPDEDKQKKIDRTASKQFVIHSFIGIEKVSQVTSTLNDTNVLTVQSQQQLNYQVDQVNKNNKKQFYKKQRVQRLLHKIIFLPYYMNNEYLYFSDDNTYIIIHVTKVKKLELHYGEKLT